MIYITGDTHNTADMHHLSTKWMKRYCGLQDVNYSDINEVIILGDFLISTDFTPTPGIPASLRRLEPSSFQSSSRVGPGDFTPDLLGRLRALYAQ